MNIRLLQRNNFVPDKEEANNLANETGLNIRFCELLISRGINTKDAVEKFFNPSVNDLYDPFLLAGMSEAVERINIAIENNEKIVVYGDYDADGICASAILSLYLSSRGLDVYTHIPSRITDGYGLSVEALEKIIENTCPDLILTCDCGISAHEEVEYALDLGVDIIITDHHEIAGAVPNCIAVNPKRTDCNYPIDTLCGAGVALKLVQALGGIEAAEHYFDLAAVATIADLVPLLDENRLIVQLGIRNIKNIGLKELLKNQQISLSNVTSSDIAYKIAPRINAAGRMGDAYRALDLLIIKDLSKICSIINDINEDNIKRKILCDTLYDEAIEDIKSENLIENRAIILCHPTWEKGITGILAARLAGDFKRPSFILIKSGDVFKGTARSVSSINIYELLSSVSDILEEFGGHSQAAGFSVLERNIELFKKRINEYLKQFDDTCFLPSCEYDLEIELREINKEFCKTLELFEPVGNSNSRPIFKTTASKLNVSICKTNYNHTSIVADGLPVMAFNFYNENQFLMGDSPKELLIEPQLNVFNSKETARAVLRAVSPSELFVNENTARAAYLKNLEHIPTHHKKNAVITTYNIDELKGLIADSLMLGTMIVAGSKDSYLKAKGMAQNKYFLHEFMYSSSKNNLSRIVVSPLLDNSFMLENYNRIIFIDSPIGYTESMLNSRTKAQIFLPRLNNESKFLGSIDLSRDTLLKYFDAIKNNNNLSSLNIFSFFKLLSARVNDLELSQFIVSWLIFYELDLVKCSTDCFAPSINKGAKCELKDSLIYQYINQRLKA